MSNPLTAREARFVACYRLHGNAALAAREAGYAAYQTNTMGWKILHRPKIIAALREHGIEIVPARQKPGPPGEARRPGRYRRRGLTLRQERFVLEYLIDGNATQAAIRAGLPAKSPVKAGSAMLHQREVAQAIERARAAAAARLTISADRVKNELAAIAFASIADVADWGPEGVTLKEKKTVAPQDRAAIAEFFCEKLGKAGRREEHDEPHAGEDALEAARARRAGAASRPLWPRHQADRPSGGRREARRQRDPARAAVEDRGAEKGVGAVSLSSFPRSFSFRHSRESGNPEVRIAPLPRS